MSWLVSLHGGFRGVVGELLDKTDCFQVTVGCILLMSPRFILQADVLRVGERQNLVGELVE